MTHLTDIEIAQSCKMQPIERIAQKAHIPAECLEHYGKYKAKVDLAGLEKHIDKSKQGKLKEHVRWLHR